MFFIGAIPISTCSGYVQYYNMVNRYSAPSTERTVTVYRHYELHVQTYRACVAKHIIIITGPITLFSLSPTHFTVLSLENIQYHVL